MTLDEAYRHIKASYIHHSQERNAVLLPQAELIAMECIEKCKQADVQPVNHGRMIPFTDEERYEFYKKLGRDYDGICSECGSCMFDTDCYCAECGAKMDGE